MLRIFFTTEDLVCTTVAPTSDPLWDVLLASRRLAERDQSPVFAKWSYAVRRAIDHRDPALRLLHVLRPCPDFLLPAESARGLEAGLAAVRATPRHRVRAELACLAPLPGWVEPLARGDDAALGAVADMLRRLHSVLVEPFADVIRESVNADRARRARDLVDDGVHGLLAGLGGGAHWRPPVLEVDHPVDREVRLGGRGLRLVPSYFARHRPGALTDPSLPPVLVHPIDDTDRWAGSVPKSLDALLGPTRSAVLECARTGVGTVELARRVGTSPASVSRHTCVLRDAGLLRTTRYGKRAVHSLTELGESLLEGAVR
ncbi:ArsR/SmtB family transcription factor [Saccharothrix syringae]|uniref:Transcriptional regulator n=1 Tax=Saccharothrix syringae TaxID=103733 RepID=A0A5Q0H5M2_SACSY|nr:helix-turn-helix transcriptional regulator [Saccharothrix syringae]QFZ21496.1 transcriptional regulator [Saccharothrix syringae]